MKRAVNTMTISGGPERGARRLGKEQVTELSEAPQARTPALTVLTALGIACLPVNSAMGLEPIHVSIVMHNEEPPQYPDFVNDPSAFWQHRNALVPFVNMLSANGVMFNYQSDWNFLMAVGMYDGGTPSTNGKNIVRYIKEDLGFEVDPHAHATIYSYADVAYLIGALGVPPSGTPGGGLAFPPESAVWEAFWGPINGVQYPGYTWQAEMLWVGGTLYHQNEEHLWTSGVWKPRDKYHFLIHDDDAPLPNVGHFGGSRASWQNLDRLLTMQQAGELEDGEIYTCTIFVPQDSLLVPGTTQAIAQKIQSHDASGVLRWMGLAEVIGVWETEYNSQPNILRWITFGDSDDDGDLDPADFAQLVGCFSGPGGGPIDPDCYVFDREPDDDVDLVDFALFQSSFTGSL